MLREWIASITVSQRGCVAARLLAIHMASERCRTPRIRAPTRTPGERPPRSGLRITRGRKTSRAPQHARNRVSALTLVAAAGVQGFFLSSDEYPRTGIRHRSRCPPRNTRGDGTVPTAATVCSEHPVCFKPVPGRRQGRGSPGVSGSRSPYWSRASGRVVLGPGTRSGSNVAERWSPSGAARR